ncbi:MAG: ABC transporter permease [Bacteroidota bacterium]|uniref:Putative ABC transport system permease protein n=1 Tax=Algoriphagus faecimaris TaxID=686796 RepID=A0A1G6NCP2_9BACT|nr:ABC transporter permease [Algoriphagus faecimaris]SDC65603.1 putative ABC transport system permease protein [Algoriphagus faecimaris]
MWKNYLKIAYRNLLKNKIYSGINVFGLSLGMAASLLILIYVLDELSYDTFHPKGEQVYRIGMQGSMNGNDFDMPFSPAPMAQAMIDEIPEVEDATRIGVFRTMPMRFEEKTFTEPITLVVDPNFFEFFGFELLKGNPEEALTGPDKVILTASTAQRYFGSEDPVGKVLFRGSEKTATEVTGVVADPPHNSHLDFEMLLSADSWGYMKDLQWSSNNLYTYFRIYPEADPKKAQQGIDGFISKYFGPEIQQFLGISLDSFLEQGNRYGYAYIPMMDIHLYSGLAEDIKPGGNIQYLYIFAAIALFIILIACINFMNLATARASNRAKEVGVRKAIGAQKSRLVYQFLTESMLYSLISGLLAFLLILLALSPFNALSGKDLGLELLINPFFLVGFFSFILLVGLMAGSYPAFYLTSFSPVTVLKGKIRSGVKRSNFRNGLVVFQFFISICLIISSMVVYKQLRYMQEKNLGFDKENVVDLLHTRALGTNAEAFKQDLLSQSGFVSASYANTLPPNIDWNSVFRTTDSQQDFLCNLNFVDHDQLETLGYKMAQGRFFSRQFPSDTGAVVLNETAFRQMGWTELDGSQKVSGFWNVNSEPVARVVIGVIQDFNFESLRASVRPLIMTLGDIPNNEMAIRLNAGNPAEKLAILEETWKKHADGAPFEYSFIDSNFQRLFLAEQKMGNIILVFTVLAISIACLGLFGLAAYTTEQRSKEISIRKALGASMPHLVTILSRDFTLLVLIAFLFAGPLAYYLMNTYWLGNFAYRIEIGSALIFIAGFMAILIAWITVSYQSFKTAASNPVDYLKNE